MKFKILLFAFILSGYNFMFSQSQSQNLNLMPYPDNLELNSGKFRISEQFSAKLNQQGRRAQKAADRFLSRLAKRTGLFIEDPFSEINLDETSSNFNISYQKEGLIKLNEDESYYIKINTESIHLEAVTDIGVIRGFETLLQLLSSDEEGYFFPEVVINDSPRFPWRGLLIDACRHFMPIDVIKRNLDGMAAVKMNTLHWHLSEDQGFRVESKTFPKLHELGSDGLYYTHEQVKEILNYASDRGIRVIPEFDVPGHATAILAAYPELGSAPGPYEIERDWGIFDPTLNPILDTTYIFLDKLFGEMSELFPDEYFHIGGDENNGKQWDSNEEIQEFMKKMNFSDNHAMQGYFNNQLLKILTKYDKKMVGWDEIFHSSMPNNIVIQSWRGKEALIEAAKKGYQAILSNGYYIDLIQPTDFHYLNDPLEAEVDLDESEKNLILGGEATMWSEMISTETIDSRIWPRTAAIAERLWSPQNIKDVEDMYRRLENISFQLEEHGLTHIKNYEMMLRRLTNNKDTEALENLISVIEPVKIYNRYRLRKQTQQTPLSRVVDAATADAKDAREFRNIVDEFLSEKKVDNKKVQQIKSYLALWKNNHFQLKKVIENSPILKEIELMSENLTNLSQVGLDILEITLGERTVTESWQKESLDIINKAKEPVAQTELMIVSAIEKLLNSIK
jgi:hexosaminidase